MTTRKPRMLVVRPIRDSALSHYAFYQNFNVDYTILSDKPYKPFFKNLNKNVSVSNLLFHKPKFNKFINKLIPFPNLRWNLANKEIEEKIKNTDIVNITDTYYFYSAQIAKLAKKYNKPLITVIWMTIPNHITTWFFPYSINTNIILKNTNLFILRNKTAYQFTDSLGIKRKKTKVVYKGVNVDFFKSNKNKNNKNINILFVGSLNKSKGIKDLANVFKRLTCEYSNIKLLIVGSGSLEKSLKKSLNGYPVIFYGFTKYEKLAGIYARADIFCAPSRQLNWFGLKVWEEYFSYVLMEAQASGLPIVTTKIGGIPEEVDEKNFIIEPGNEDSLYKSLKDLIINKNKREILGKINRKRAEKFFNAKIQAQKTEKIILEYVKK